MEEIIGDEVAEVAGGVAGRAVEPDWLRQFMDRLARDGAPFPDPSGPILD